MTALELILCLQQINKQRLLLTCAPISELPYVISTMVNTSDRGTFTGWTGHQRVGSCSMHKGSRKKSDSKAGPIRKKNLVLKLIFDQKRVTMATKQEAGGGGGGCGVRPKEKGPFLASPLKM